MQSLYCRTSCCGDAYKREWVGVAPGEVLLPAILAWMKERSQRTGYGIGDVLGDAFCAITAPTGPGHVV